MDDSSRACCEVMRGGSYFRKGSRPLETVRLTGFLAGSGSWPIAVKASPLIRSTATVNITPASRLIDVFVSCIVIFVFTSSDASRSSVTWRVVQEQRAAAPELFHRQHLSGERVADGPRKRNTPLDRNGRRLSCWATAYPTA